MQVTLHLGAHRTGMGGLLGALMANTGALKGAGIAVWDPDELRGGLGAGLARSPSRTTLNQDQQARRSTGRIQLRQSQLEREGVQRLLALGPDLLGMPSEALSRGMLYPNAGERLFRAAPAFADRCDLVSLGIRRMDRWWASALATGVAAGRHVPEPTGLETLASHPRQWRHVIREIAVAFPKAQLVVWPSEVLMDLPERQIVELMGGKEGPLLTPYRGQSERAPNADRLEKILAERGDPRVLPRDGNGHWAPFNRSQVEAFTAQYQEDLAWLRAGAGGRATAIGLDGADLRPELAVQQQGAEDHDPSEDPQRLGRDGAERTPRPPPRRPDMDHPRGDRGQAGLYRR